MTVFAHKNWWRTALLVPFAFVLTATAAPVGKPEAAAEWLLFRGNAHQTGVVSAALPDKLDVLWKFTTKDAIEGAPAIARGLVYVGSQDGHLYAVNLATGKEKWKYKAAGFKASPAVKGDAVYAGDIDGVFHCLDAATGAKRWTFQTDADISSAANFHGDHIVFGSGDESLYCLTAQGKKAWDFKVPGGPVMASPAIVDGVTFVAGCDSAVHVIDLKAGKELASIELAGQVGATAAVIGDMLYVGTMTNEVQAVDWKKKKVEWTFRQEKRAQPFAASVAATDKLVIAGSRDKNFYALDRKDGHPVWTFTTEGRIEASPVVAGKRVYAASLDSKLYVLDLEKGTLIQKIELDSPVTGSPAIVGGRLLIGTQNGTLYCLGAKSK